jgi:hypothetical protein
LNLPRRASSSKKWCVGTLIFATAVSIAAFAGPQQSFDRIYGGRLKAATTASQKQQFAEALLKDAAGLADDKPLQAFIYEKAYDLTAAEPLGYPTAYQAMDELAKAQPDIKARVDEKLTAILERQSRTGSPIERQAAAAHYVNRSLSQAEAYEDTGDNEHAIAVLQRAVPIAQIAGRERAAELGARIKEIHVHQVWEKQASEMATKLENDPHDAKTALELVRLLVLDMDQPTRAVKIVPKAQDAELTEAVLLAADSPDALMPDQLVRVGNWYHEQAPKESDTAKYVALHRASQYYGQFLKGYPKEDASRLGVKQAFASVQKELSREPALMPRRVIDLLCLANPKADAVFGTWAAAGTNLVSTSPGSAKLAFRYTPPTEYVVRLTFQKPANTSVIVIASSAGHSFAWIVGAVDGTNCGLELVNGKVCTENGTGVRLPAFRQPGLHTAELIVRDGLVTATLDGSLVSRYEGDFSALTLPAWDDLNGGAIGIRVEGSAGPTVFQRVELAEFNSRGHPSK